MRGYSIKSKTVICHIRKANRGRIMLENTPDLRWVAILLDKSPPPAPARTHAR